MLKQRILFKQLIKAPSLLMDNGAEDNNSGRERPFLRHGIHQKIMAF